MAKYDSLFIEHPNDEEKVILSIGKMDIEDFSDYVTNLSHSLWFMRMLQIDVFESFDIQRQYVFLSRSFMNNSELIPVSKAYSSFFIQLMSSSEIDIEIKKAVYDNARKSNVADTYMFEEHNEIYNMIHKNISREEMIMTMQLYGIDRYAEPTIMYYLLQGNKDMLIWMYENCPDVIKDGFDISDLIETWMKEKN